MMQSRTRHFPRTDYHESLREQREREHRLQVRRFWIVVSPVLIAGVLILVAYQFGVIAK